MSSAIDPIKKLYMVTYVSTASGGNPDRCLIYNWARQRWSYIRKGYRALFNAYTVGYTLEGLDAVSTSIDALPLSLDSAQWKGGSQYFGGFSTNSEVGTFTGDPLVARWETGCWQITPDMRSFMTGIRPMVELIDTSSDIGLSTPKGTGDIKSYVGVRDRIQDTVSFGAASVINFNGECPVRANARYHRVRVEVSGGFSHATGFDFYARKEGMR